MRQALGLRGHSGKHMKRDKKPDVQSLLKEIIASGVAEIKPRHGRATVGNIDRMKECPDLYQDGLLKMVDGKF